MKEKTNNPKVLLHACCAICSGYPITLLRELGYEPVVYFFNPNIYPQEEYLKRLEAEEILCNYFNCELIAGEYSPQAYNNAIKGYEGCPEGGERCQKCFELRLLNSAQKAKTLGIEYFTTSLSISPHKNLELIQKIGKTFAKDFELTFIETNFRKNDGVLKTNKISKTLNLYRQNYCGCEMSGKGNGESEK